MIYNIIISPIEMILDWIFTFICTAFSQVGIIGAIVGVSVAVNILSLPLYNVADKIQSEERNISKKLEKWVVHIKKTFKGNEQYMMLSEYYRQNHYHPIYSLRSTVPVIIQVPFFIAAYHYLRTNDCLLGSSFWIFKDLGAPDSLIRIGGFSINILPILMTLINCLSGAIYSKGLALKDRLQIYILAVFFLVVLYNSPSGLVIYWILNNIFSLVKNIMKKSKYEKWILYFGFSFLLLLFAHFKLYETLSFKRKSLLVFSYMLLIAPLIYSWVKNSSLGRKVVSLESFFYGAWKNINMKLNELVAVKKSFFVAMLFSGLGLCFLLGLVLPSSVISTSPIEFYSLGNTETPIPYITSSFFVFLGFFVFWPLAIYKMSDNKVRGVLSILFFAFFLTALFNVYVFSFDYGNIDVTFDLQNINILENKKYLFTLIPAEIFVASIVVFLLFLKFDREKILTVCVFSICAAEFSLGLFKVNKIKNVYTEYEENLRKYGNKGDIDGTIEPVYHLSKTGKNVVVFFLDRAIGPFVGKIFDEYPEIKKNFDGFTWYPNTLSFSDFTVTGSPSIYGGYEYSQLEMNKRSDELLKDKNTEAQLVIGKLFADAGFDVLMSDPPWTDYMWSGALGCYQKAPEVTVKEFEGKYLGRYIIDKRITQYESPDLTCDKQIKNFSVLQSLYPDLRFGFYSNCRKMATKVGELGFKAFKQFFPYSNIYYLNNLTDFTNEKDSCVLIHSLSTHDVYMTLAEDLESEAEYQDPSPTKNIYLANAAVLRRLCFFFNYLKDNDVFDNTRVILVSDHGGDVDVPYTESFKNKKLVNWYSAMLLVKDFNSNEPVKIDNAFMTNADTLFIAKDGLTVSDINPFTGKKLVPNKKNGVDVFHCVDWSADNFRDKTQFELDENQAWHVSENIYEEKNWVPLKEWKKNQGTGK